ncbi:hypothetical protein ES705_15568 [subsurface metagenome]
MGSGFEGLIKRLETFLWVNREEDTKRVKQILLSHYPDGRFKLFKESQIIRDPSDDPLRDYYIFVADNGIAEAIKELEKKYRGIGRFLFWCILEESEIVDIVKTLKKRGGETEEDQRQRGKK